MSARKRSADGGSDLELPAPGKATINDIARLGGVSTTTVSRIINPSPLVRDDTRDKIAALMQQFGYVPDLQARGLAFRRSFLIGLVYDNSNAQPIDRHVAPMRWLRRALEMQEGARECDSERRSPACLSPLWAGW